MARLGWTVQCSVLFLLVIALGRDVGGFVQLNVDNYQEFVEETRGLLEKVACLDAEGRMCPNCPSCIKYTVGGFVDDDQVIQDWFKLLNFTMAETSHYASMASWNYVTNITKYNIELLSNISLISGNYGIMMREQGQEIVQDGLDRTSRRMMKFVLNGGHQRDPAKRRLLEKTVNKMQTIYSTGKVCPSGKSTGKSADKDSGSADDAGCLALEPDLTDIMAHSRDYDELLRVWKGWRDAVGPKIGALYPTYVALKNESSTAAGYSSYTDILLDHYEDDSFEEEVDKLWEEVKPLYEHLHAYVRRKLAAKYGARRVDADGPIPAHLLGNMWAQQWNNIYDVVEPFPNRGTIDVTDTMKEQGWTVQQMFQVAERFFKSIGLDPMPDTFWSESMIEKPTDRDVVCHGSAHDFSENRDVRIKMCTVVNMEDLYVVHHEMGHCEYYLQYSKQHMIFRNGANPGFHEAVGDTIALSVVTPDYLHQIGLLPSKHVDKSQEINYLMEVALNKIAFLPFGLLIDKWRWQVFRGAITPDQYNEKWWELRRKYQGVAPPVDRSSNDFDPGAKYHIPSGTPYIRYFVSFLVQFQFHEALCQAASNYGPLHLCNIYNSKEAGARLKSMLEMGTSKPWPEAMFELTGGYEMDTGAIKTYFRPLIDWLEQENDGQLIGWDDEARIFRREGDNTKRPRTG